jgi:N-formylglutamate amidohydrolase
MSAIVAELYDVLRKLGASNDDARAASRAVLDENRLATKQDLAELEARLAWKIGTAIIGSMVSMTGIFAIIVGWIQR